MGKLSLNSVDNAVCAVVRGLSWKWHDARGNNSRWRRSRHCISSCHCCGQTTCHTTECRVSNTRGSGAFKTICIGKSLHIRIDHNRTGVEIVILKTMTFSIHIHRIFISPLALANKPTSTLQNTTFVKMCIRFQQKYAFVSTTTFRELSIHFTKIYYVFIPQQHSWQNVHLFYTILPHSYVFVRMNQN